MAKIKITEMLSSGNYISPKLDDKTKRRIINKTYKESKSSLAFRFTKYSMGVVVSGIFIFVLFAHFKDINSKVSLKYVYEKIDSNFSKSNVKDNKSLSSGYELGIASSGDIIYSKSEDLSGSNENNQEVFLSDSSEQSNEKYFADSSDQKDKRILEDKPKPLVEDEPKPLVEDEPKPLVEDKPKQQNNDSYSQTENDQVEILTDTKGQNNQESETQKSDESIKKTSSPVEDEEINSVLNALLSIDENDDLNSDDEELDLNEIQDVESNERYLSMNSSSETESFENDMEDDFGEGDLKVSGLVGDLNSVEKQTSENKEMISEDNDLDSLSVGALSSSEDDEISNIGNDIDVSNDIEIGSLSIGNKVLYNKDLDVVFGNFTIKNNSSNDVVINNILFNSKFNDNSFDSIEVSIDGKKYNLNNLSLNLSYFLDSNESAIINVKGKIKSEFVGNLQIGLSTLNFKDLETNKTYKKRVEINGYLYDVKNN